MRRLLLSLLILAFSVSLTLADGVIKRRGSGGGTSYLVSEDFEGSAPSWTQQGTPTVLNYSYGTNPLEGTYSLRIVGPGTVVGTYVSTDAQTHVYGFFETLSTNIHGTDFFSLRDGSGNQIFSLYWSATNFFTLWDTSAKASSITPVFNTKYYVWYEYQTGSGNGIAKIYISTTTTKPGSPSISVTNGNYSASAVRHLYSTNGSNNAEWRFDHVRISTTDITGYPE